MDNRKYKKYDFDIDFSGPNSTFITSPVDNFRLIDVVAKPMGANTLITGRVIQINKALPLAGMVVKILDTRTRLFSRNSSSRMIGTTVTGAYGKFRLDVPRDYNYQYVLAETMDKNSNQSNLRIVDLRIYEGKYDLDDGLKFDVNSQ